MKLILSKSDLNRAQHHLTKWRQDNENAGADLKMKQGRRYFGVTSLVLSMWAGDEAGTMRALDWLDNHASETTQ